MDAMKEILHVALAYEHAKRALKELEGASNRAQVEQARVDLDCVMTFLKAAALEIEEGDDV